MKQQQFEQLHQEKWRVFKSLLDEKSRQSHFMGLSKYEFIRLYRMVCQHYALAKQRHYSPQLINELHQMVLQGHQNLYTKKGNMLNAVYQFYRHVFPVRFRALIHLFWLSFACFTVPLVVMGLLCYYNADMLYSVMSPHQVMDMESMYNPANAHFGRSSDRQSDTDLAMFGVYIQNNIGIDFQIYGMGIFAGIGTLFSVIFNGLIIGGVSGHLTGIGYGETFWQFVFGHGSFELTAAVISGAAGLRLGQSLFMPGNYSRTDALKIAGKESIELLLGAASMTFIAAFIEAFWSSSNVISPSVKYVVAFFLWSMVIGYLAFVGKKSYDK